MSRFLLITDSSDFEARTRAATSGAMTGAVQRMSVDAGALAPSELLARSTGEPTDVVILGPDMDRELALGLATAFDLQRPDVSVVLAAASDPTLVMRAMRAGIRDIAEPSPEPAQLRILLERSSMAAEVRRRQQGGEAAHERGRGRVIAIMSPKGGVGKTTVATNLAVGIAKTAPMSVVIVDLDLQFGDVASSLNLDPEHTITEAVFGAAAQDSMVLKAYLSVDDTGVYALCGPRSPADADLITPEQVASLVAQLAAEFQYVILDTAPGLGEHLLAALEQATDAVWVCGMDVPSIRGINKAFSVLGELQLLPQGRHVVLNFADRRSGLSVQDIESSIGVPVDAAVPWSRSIPLSTNKGMPLLADRVRDGASKGLEKLVRRFGPEQAKGSGRRLHRREVVS